MVYKLGKNIFDDQECTVLEIGKEIPTVIPYTEIVRIMMIQDFKTNGIFINKILSFAIGGNPLPSGGGRSLVNL